MPRYLLVTPGEMFEMLEASNLVTVKTPKITGAISFLLPARPVLSEVVFRRPEPRGFLIGGAVVDSCREFHIVIEISVHAAEADEIQIPEMRNYSADDLCGEYNSTRNSSPEQIAPSEMSRDCVDDFAS